jgi:glyceraldehyde-3-phosphate dehydrogenase (ferredoxin)
MPDIVEKIFGLKDRFLESVRLTASRITSRNAAVFWESERNIDFIFAFLKGKKDVDQVQDPDLDRWIDRFERDKHRTAFEFWYEMHKGVHETLRDFPV